MNENARGGDIVSSEPTRPDVDAMVALLATRLHRREPFQGDLYTDEELARSIVDTLVRHFPSLFALTEREAE